MDEVSTRPRSAGERTSFSGRDTSDPNPAPRNVRAMLRNLFLSELGLLLPRPVQCALVVALLLAPIFPPAALSIGVVALVAGCAFRHSTRVARAKAQAE